MTSQKELQNQISELLEQSREPLVLTNEQGDVICANAAATAGQPSCIVQAHQERMEAVGRLAGGLVHEFNNHLGGILGYASFLKSKHEQDETLRDQLACIESSALQARDLTLRLLTFSRGAHFHRSVLNMAALTEEVAAEFNTQLPDGVDFCYSCNVECEIFVRMDSKLLKMALHQLLLNGLEALAEQGGQLKLDMICLGEHQNVHIRVSDNGPGLSKEVQRHLFEPYYSTRPNASRRGLGLSMVYGIVHGHEGALRVEAPVEGGVVFHIMLPLDTATQPACTHSEEVPHDGKGVMVVDDDGPIRQSSATALRSAGFAVHEASGGEEALQLVEQHNEIGLVLLDMIMPGLSGPEVFTLLRKRRPNLRFLLTTAHAKREHCDDLLHSGALGLLRKPYTVQDMLHTVSEILGD